MITLCTLSSIDSSIVNKVYVSRKCVASCCLTTGFFSFFKYDRYSYVDCSGHGVCIDGMCACEAMWTGKACDVPVCPNNCNYYRVHGECNRSKRRCDCTHGYKGKRSFLRSSHVRIVAIKSLTRVKCSYLFLCFSFFFSFLLFRIGLQSKERSWILGERRLQGLLTRRFGQSLFHSLEGFPLRGRRREFSSCQDDIRLRLQR